MIFLNEDQDDQDNDPKITVVGAETPEINSIASLLTAALAERYGYKKKLKPIIIVGPNKTSDDSKKASKTLVEIGQTDDAEDKPVVYDQPVTHLHSYRASVEAYLTEHNIPFTSSLEELVTLAGA
jgi:hypothetical protein